VVERGNECAIQFLWLLVHEQEPPLLVDVCFAWIVGLGQRGTGRPIRAKRIEFQRDPTHRDMYEAHFHCPVKFKAFWEILHRSTDVIRRLHSERRSRPVVGVIAIYRQLRRMPTMGWLRSLPVCRFSIPCLPEYNSAHVTDIECSGGEHSCESIAENSLGSVSSRQPRHNLLPGRAGALLRKHYRPPDLGRKSWWSAQGLLDWSPGIN
jgi:hypothetical protein